MGVQKETCVFEFDFSTGSVDCHLSTKVPIPCPFSLDEQVYRIVGLYHLPSFLVPELRASLGRFIRQRTAELEQWAAAAALDALQGGRRSAQLAESISRLYATEVLAFAGPNTTSTEELCADIYGCVVRSPALDAMLSLEQAASAEVASTTLQRDTELAELTARHAAEMDYAIGSLDADQVNRVAGQQFDDAQLVQSRWESRLTSLRATQRDNFWNWLTGVHERLQCGDTANLPRPPSLAATGRGVELPPPPPPPALEESFTIHLGTQLKQMYNLRLLAADVLQPFVYRGDWDRVDPRRIQTALHLYSSSLSGLVLLVDNRVNTFTGLRREFGALVSRATELHFAPLDSQLEEVRNTVPSLVGWRRGRQPADSSGSPPPAQLLPGDIYLTRHSNVAALHVVFHVVSDDSVQGDISSRHPVVLALRNVLKVAFLSDVTTLSIPLLLSHEMCEHMTVAWCMKRAELIYKCVKGFMMEMVSWGGQETRTIQFIVPKNLSEEMFSSLASMLPNIFRVSNPLVVKSS